MPADVSAATSTELRKGWQRARQLEKTRPGALAAWGRQAQEMIQSDRLARPAGRKTRHGVANAATTAAAPTILNDLPAALLESVLCHFDVCHHLDFSLVCRSWMQLVKTLWRVRLLSGRAQLGEAAVVLSCRSQLKLRDMWRIAQPKLEDDFTRRHGCTYGPEARSTDLPVGAPTAMTAQFYFELQRAACDVGWNFGHVILTPCAGMAVQQACEVALAFAYLAFECQGTPQQDRTDKTLAALSKTVDQICWQRYIEHVLSSTTTIPREPDANDVWQTNQVHHALTGAGAQWLLLRDAFLPWLAQQLQHVELLWRPAYDDIGDYVVEDEDNEENWPPAIRFVRKGETWSSTEQPGYVKLAREHVLTGADIAMVLAAAAQGNDKIGWHMCFASGHASRLIERSLHANSARLRAAARSQFESCDGAGSAWKPLQRFLLLEDLTAILPRWEGSDALTESGDSDDDESVTSVEFSSDPEDGELE